MIAYPTDEEFLRNDLVRLAQQVPKFGQLHALLATVFQDPRVIFAMRRDLAPPTAAAQKTGRPALPLVVTGCLSVVKALMGWGYRTLAEEVNGSAGWRWVCQLYRQPMPNFRTIQGREAKLTPKTLRLINTVVVQVGQHLGVTTASRLRVDGAVSETNIHYPTDSRLLEDAARVLSRLMRRARKVAPPRTSAEKAWFRDRHRQARRLARQIGRLARQHPKNTLKMTVRQYTQLLRVVEALLEQVTYVQPRLAASPHLAAAHLHQEFEVYRPLVGQIVAQTRKRVLEGISVPAADKIVSLFEPHTAIIRRGKAAPHETEFGRKVWLAEVDGGLISEWRILQGNPPDATQLIASLQHHRQLFGRAPREVSGDPGVYSEDNERQARRLGVRRVCLPKPGRLSARRRRRERQTWFRAAQRFRSGIEGRISQLRRARGLTRCLNHGELGMERWVGWGVIANNLATLALSVIRRRLSLTEVLA